MYLPREASYPSVLSQEEFRCFQHLLFLFNLHEEAPTYVDSIVLQCKGSSKRIINSSRAQRKKTN